MGPVECLYTLVYTADQTELQVTDVYYLWKGVTFLNPIAACNYGLLVQHQNVMEPCEVAFYGKMIIVSPT